MLLIIANSLQQQKVSDHSGVTIAWYVAGQSAKNPKAVIAFRAAMSQCLTYSEFTITSFPSAAAASREAKLPAKK